MPRRHDKLFDRIANFRALLTAARRAVRGKRKKLGAASFFANLESELLALERQLLEGTYRPGRYVAFEVNDPKKRIVSAAPFRDRVVHHALCAVIEPIFEHGFIDHSFARPTSAIATGTTMSCAATSIVIFLPSITRSSNPISAAASPAIGRSRSWI